MKKILFTLLTVAAIFMCSCSNPSSGTDSTPSGNGNSNNSNSNSNTDKVAEIRALYTPLVKDLTGQIFCYVTNTSDTDELELVIVENPNNIQLNQLTKVWKKNDTNNYLTQYGNPLFAEYNQEPNFYFDFSPNKAGTVKYRIKNKTAGWTIPPENSSFLFSFIVQGE